MLFLSAYIAIVCQLQECFVTCNYYQKHVSVEMEGTNVSADVIALPVPACFFFCFSDEYCLSDTL